MAFFHVAIEEEVIVSTTKEPEERQCHLETLERPCMARKLQVHVGKDWFVNHCAMVTGKSSQSCRVCAHNEKEDSLVSFHGDDFLAESRDTSLDKLDEVLVHSRSDACRAFCPTAGREGFFFLHRTTRWNESGFSCRPDPTHVEGQANTL